jgi:putative SOS response-associated peptidase YedK
MCGRFAQSATLKELVKRFSIEHALLDWVARYNLAPSQEIPAITQMDNGRTLHRLKWGLIPHWAKDASIGSRLVNARAETIDEKPAFRQAFRNWRCVIPADGFYEWQARQGKTKTPKTPYYVSHRDGELFGFAALYEAWQPLEGGLPVQTCTIITTEANELMKPIHHRMPVILRPEHEATWLNPNIDNREVLLDCLGPYPAELMKAHTVSTRVNKTDYDRPDCIDPCEAPVVGEEDEEKSSQMNLFD